MRSHISIFNLQPKPNEMICEFNIGEQKRIYTVWMYKNESDTMKIPI